MEGPTVSIDGQDPLADGQVDVRQLLDQLSVEELAETADAYFRANLDGKDYYLAKPFWSTSEVTDLLITFGQVLGALAPAPGMRVLDFGAGTGWTSRCLSQMGCEVIVSDVSATALDLARELYASNPVVGSRPPPSFLLYDGRRIDLPDQHVDRVICFDALHHTPNPAQVLAEMGRVLKPGCRAAFSEPGPNHSRTGQSQFEMRNYRVIENDILMGQIRDWARPAGFSRLRLAAFTASPYLLEMGEYEDLLAGGDGAAQRYLDHHQEFLRTRRIFVLHKEGSEQADSRSRDGLAGEVSVSLATTELAAGQALEGTYRVTNTGTNRWLPSDADLAPVLIGVHLFDQDGLLLERDFARVPLSSATGIEPGRGEDGSFALEAPGPGNYVVEFDLVAEGIAWFEINGCAPWRSPLLVS